MIGTVAESIRRMKHPKMMVFTIRSEKKGGLAAMREALHKAFDKIRRRAFFKRVVKGGFWFVGLTYSAEEGWHYHIHCVVDGGFIPLRVLDAAWVDCTGGAGLTVDVSRIRSAAASAADIVNGTKKSGGENDMAKLSPAFDLDPDLEDELMAVMAGRRWFGTWGDFVRVDLDALYPVECLCPVCGAVVSWWDWEIVEREISAAGWRDYKTRGVLWRDCVDGFAFKSAADSA